MQQTGQLLPKKAKLSSNHYIIPVPALMEGPKIPFKPFKTFDFVEGCLSPGSRCHYTAENGADHESDSG